MREPAGAETADTPRATPKNARPRELERAFAPYVGYSEGPISKIIFVLIGLVTGAVYKSLWEGNMPNGAPILGAAILRLVASWGLLVVTYGLLRSNSRNIH